MAVHRECTCIHTYVWDNGASWYRKLSSDKKASYAIEKEGGGAVILRLTSAQYFSGMPAALHRTGEGACVRTGKTLISWPLMLRCTYTGLQAVLGFHVATISKGVRCFDREVL